MLINVSFIDKLTEFQGRDEVFTIYKYVNDMHRD